MSTKNRIIIIAFIVALVASGVLFYSWRYGRANARMFPYSGYILTADPEREGKQVLFGADTVWKTGLSDSVDFDDVQGSQLSVSSESFVHYDNQVLTTLKKGVVVDLNDVSTAKMTGHYAIAPTVNFIPEGSSYVLGNTAAELQFSDFLWKIGQDKYMLVSPHITLDFGDGDAREVEKFVEIAYIDQNVIQLQTAENMWQTVSDRCSATLDNGAKVDLSLRNVADAAGEILMDFSKIVLDAEDNIEITPLTEELADVKESVIPHFDITAESGQDGETGTLGKNGTDGVGGEGGVGGADGTTGTDGRDGQAGSAGSAGSAGKNGSAGSGGSGGSSGSPGASGSNGQDGSSAVVDGTVLNFPVFALESWNVSATGCSATIRVSDQDGMLLSNTQELASSVYLVDVATNSLKENFATQPAFDTLDPNGYPISFNNLEPDHPYRLVVAAPIDTNTENSSPYLRDFVSKTFWTDSTGVFMELAGRGTASVSLTVRKQSYASASLENDITVYLYGSLDAAARATAAAPENNLLASQTVSLTSGSALCTFDWDLFSNRVYYARMVVQTENTKLMPDQILALTTLKVRATVGAPTLTPNRDSWGFDLAPGAIYDPDKGVTGFTYEFYNEGDVGNGALIHSNIKPVKTVITTSGSGLVVPLDGVALKPGLGYYVRTLALFNDNEKTSWVTSPFSNLARLNGSRLPGVYFVNDGSFSADQVPDTAADFSKWYDQLYGSVMIAPGTEGAKLLLDKTHRPKVTVRASGYYYAQYPVYLADDVPADGSGYLVGRVLPGGYVQIDVPAKALSAAAVDGTGAVNGLRPDLQYRVMVSGDLSEDGQNAYELNVLVGTCVVQTPDTVAVRASWADSGDAGANAFVTKVTFSARAGVAPEEKNTFNRQMETLSSLKLTLISGSHDNPGKDLGTLTLTESNYKTLLKTQDAADAPSLGALMEKGLTLTEEAFGLKAANLTGLSTVHIKVSEVSDYTVLAKNRVNQKAYQINEPGDTAAPPSGTSDGAVYINIFKITGVTDDCHDLQLSATPDPLPAPERGLIVTRNDDNKDGVKDDSYTLIPEYLNTGKLAKTITFIAFDYPDFHRDYTSDGKWMLDAANYPGCPLTAVTALEKSTGAMAALASVTIQVPISGKMPTARFIPQTVAGYYTTLYSDPAQAQEKIDAYEAGVTADAGGNLIFFYGPGHENEPATGHQFVFAWTLTYQLQNDVETKYYPFSLGQQYVNYLNIPHSAPQDVPYKTPVAYALPWTSTREGVTWCAYIQDPEGAVLKGTGATAAQLYDRTAATAGTALTGNTAGDVMAQIDVDRTKPGAGDLTGQHLVTVFHTGSAASVAASVRVQWYTNKYTVDGAGLFDTNGNAKGYTKETVQYSAYRQTLAGGGAVIPYYKNVFTFYHDPAEFTDSMDASGISLVLKEEYTDGNKTSINRYTITISGPAAKLDKVNGVRLTFTGAGGGSAVSLDKYLEGVDGSLFVRDPNETNKYNITFRIALGSELGTLAGQSGVSVAACLLYETGEEGMSAAGGKTMALRTYSAPMDSGTGRKLLPSGRYRFNAAGVLANHVTAGNDLPYWGSFFTLTPDGLTGLKVTSTRNSAITAREERVSVDCTGAAGLTAGNLVLAPRTLAESGKISVKIFDAEGRPLDQSNFPLPRVTPIITYSKPGVGANNIQSDYSVTVIKTEETYFLLSKRVDNHWVIQRKNSSGQWENDESASAVSPDAGLLTKGTGASSSSQIAFTGLDSGTMYLVTAFYYDVPSGIYKPLNMFDSSGNEIQNRLQLTTSAEPQVTLRSTYWAGSYSGKRIQVDLNVSQVVDFYYTLELQQQTTDLDSGEADWEFITYLDVGSASKAIDGKIDIFDVGIAKTMAEGEQPTAFGNGLVYRADGFHPNGTLDKTTQRVYLDYGQSYRVQVRVYNNGKGPAAGGTVEDDLIHTASGMQSAAKVFSVNSTNDVVNLSGAYQVLTNEQGQSIPSITFSPAYIRGAAALRQDRYAVAVVRARLDTGSGQLVYSDVTGDLTSTADGSWAPNMPLSLNATHKLRLTNEKRPDLFQKGDIFTCYLYAIRDSYSTVSTGGYGAAELSCADILAGRVLGSEDTPLSTSSLEVDHGRSVLLATRSVEYTTSDTSAGVVTVAKQNDDFIVTLTNPVHQGMITHMAWSVTALYTTAADPTVQALSAASGTASVPQVPTNMVQTSTNIYQITLAPIFQGLPLDARIQSYTVTLQFYRQDGGDFVSSDILMEAGADCTVRWQSDGGYRLTAVIELSEAESIQIMALRMGETLPLETAPVQTELDGQPEAPEQTEPEGEGDAVPEAPEGTLPPEKEAETAAPPSGESGEAEEGAEAPALPTPTPTSTPQQKILP